MTKKKKLPDYISIAEHLAKMNTLKKKILSKDKEWTIIQNNYKKTIKQLEGIIKEYVLQIEKLEASTPKYQPGDRVYKVCKKGKTVVTESFKISEITIYERNRQYTGDGISDWEDDLFGSDEEAFAAMKKLIEEAESN